MQLPQPTSREILDHKGILREVSRDVEHGNPSTYSNMKCRCTRCRLAWTHYMRPRIRSYRRRRHMLSRTDARIGRVSYSPQDDII